MVPKPVYMEQPADMNDEGAPPEHAKTPASSEWRQILVNKAIDLVIVIVGVTIAFKLSNLKQESDQKALGRYYLENLITDLDKDLIEVDENLKELEFDQRLVVSCATRMGKTIDVTDSLGMVVLNASSSKTFEGHRNTYATMLNTNGLSAIGDQEVRNLLSEYYRSYTSIERFEQSYTTFSAEFLKYFSVFIDFNNITNMSSRDVLKNVQTRNLLSMSANQIQQGIWRYQGTRDKAKELREKIAALR